MGGQLDELLASPAAHCRVYLQLWLYCILSVARWQINMMTLTMTVSRLIITL